jgi:hypothetical protein
LEDEKPGEPQILDKYPRTEKGIKNPEQKWLKNHQQVMQEQKKVQKRGSADQLRVK